MKNYDPRMHTAKHILNQTMDRVFGCGRCISAHIEKKRSKCDYRFKRPLTDEELRELENRINAVIAADLPVTEEWTAAESARVAFNLERLPSDADVFVFRAVAKDNPRDERLFAVAEVRDLTPVTNTLALMGKSCP